MPPTLLRKLKELQHPRADRSPFATHRDFMTWADAVGPLLSFNEQLRTDFRAAVSEVEALNAKYGLEEPVRSVNNALGILNQAISFVEHGAPGLGKVDSIPASAPQPTASSTNHMRNWHNKPVGLIGVGVIIVLLGAIVVYLVKTHLHIPL